MDMNELEQLNRAFENAGKFIEDFEFNPDIQDTMKPHSNILSILTGTALAMVEFDWEMGLNLGADAIKIAYQLGYIAGVNSVIYSRNAGNE